MKNELYHYGILGMKWGVRRYQNPDGTYTEVGKRRRRNEESKPDTRSVKELGDQELRERTNRLNLENNYLNALRNNQQLTSRQVSAGEKFVKGLLATAASAAVAGVVSAYAKNFSNAFKGPAGGLGKEHGQAVFNAGKNFVDLLLDKRIGSIKIDRISSND